MGECVLFAGIYGGMGPSEPPNNLDDVADTLPGRMCIKQLPVKIGVGLDEQSCWRKHSGKQRVLMLGNLIKQNIWWF